ncbi:protein-glutamine gamma-glutamyltransferase E-like [Rhinoderma darwinii]|uniref:protein-glutamine gamma-glutamyltransferase E-like n=1 Tax=Rhinoderma darwinii TaxID=43563 RepID=UPI003F66F252
MMLDKMNIRGIFRQLLRGLYDSPRARIHTSGFVSEAFTLEKGTHQGCPLSPLLFDLALEPLARLLEAGLIFTGITIGEQERPYSKLLIWAKVIVSEAGLQLSNVNFQLSTNTSAHRTRDYDTTELVVRRGQGFTISFTSNRAVQSGDGVTITVETGSRPSESKNTRAVMAVSSSGSRTTWNAVRGSSTNNSLTITINPPVTAIIGRYRMNLQVTSGGRTSSSNLGSFVLLFNAWASGDEVYMNSDAERTEYVLNDVGLYWYGNANSFDSRRWDYGQFEQDILNICLTLLDRSSVYASDATADVSRRNDPLHVGRVLSAMVNSNDNDYGVIVGNWSGSYSGGVNPTQWNGSVAILRQWMRSGPVKFGQCWVYAGVLCTVLRCLGIPARVIINFESAHDTDRNLVVDNYYDLNGKKDNSRTNDSVWNFHAWNEAWSVRKDIGSFYNGWQILDSTPQEPSGGVFRLGPCSLKAVKEGDVDLNFDTAFVFGEVNADTKHWLVNENGKDTIIYSESQNVGWNTSTKAVGSFTRADVTNDYKYPEGSAKEREIFQKAQNKLQPPATTARFRMASVRDVIPESQAVKPEFSGTFNHGETQVGEDLIMKLTLKSTAANTRTVKVNMTATAIIYNSTPVQEILTESQSVTLGANEEKSISFNITYPQYENAITPDNMIEIVAVCEDEMGGKLLIDKVATLKNPPLLFRLNDQARLNTPSTVDMIFSNPIQGNVDDSVLRVEGSGLMKEPVIVKVPVLKQNQRVTIKFEITPYRVGEKSLMADYSSKKFPNVKAFQSVAVSPC